MRELARRGEHVVYYDAEEFQAHVERAQAGKGVGNVIVVQVRRGRGG